MSSMRTTWNRDLRIGSDFSILGAWGGQCIPEFEVDPPPELKQCLPLLALRTSERDSWTNIATWSEAFPVGAGLCVRRDVVAEFQRQTAACHLRQVLDRKGEALLSGQDYDIDLTACEMGLGCGVFHTLKLTHLIPARRLTVDYMLKLTYGHAFSTALLLTARGKPPSDPLPTGFKRVARKVRLRRQPYPRRALIWAQMTGTHDGLRFGQEPRSVAKLSDALSRVAPLLP